MPPALPSLFYLPCSKSMVETISCVLEHIAKGNANVELTEEDYETFEFFTSEWTYQWMTVPDYVSRLVQYAACGKEVFIVALCLLKRLEDANAIPPITPLTVHRCFLGALVMAIKMCEDQTLKSCDLATVGCITPHQMWLLEHYMFKSFNYNCFVGADEYTQCKEHLFSFESVRRQEVLPLHESFLSPNEVMSINSLFDFVDHHLKQEREQMREERARPMSIALWASPVAQLEDDPQQQEDQSSPKPPPTPPVVLPSTTMESPAPPSSRRTKFKIFSARSVSPKDDIRKTTSGGVVKKSHPSEMGPPRKRKSIAARLGRTKSVNHAVFLIRQDST